MCLLTLPAVVKTMLHSPHWNIRWPSWLQNHIIDIHLLETAVNCSRNIFLDKDKMRDTMRELLSHDMTSGLI